MCLKQINELKVCLMIFFFNYVAHNPPEPKIGAVRRQ